VSFSGAIPSFTISSVRQGLLEKKFSARELAEAALLFAEAENPKTNAYLTFSRERALKTAAHVDEEIAKKGFVGALAGVPLGVKDVIVTRGLRTTCGSRILEKYIPPYDATAVFRLEAEGAILKWRDTMGATDPQKAAPGTIRHDLGTSIGNNCTHGSDAADTAAFEIGYFFPGLDLI